MTIASTARRVFFLIALAALAIAGGGFLAGELLNIKPCPLCIFQRLLYMTIIVWGLGGFLFPGKRKFFGLASAASALGGLATAVYQSWMQLYPGLAVECGYGEMNLIEKLVDWLGIQWPAVFMATGFCTSRESLLGLSLANWSALCFGAFIVAGCWVGLSRRFRRYRFR